jgi:hypothetical protein
MKNIVINKQITPTIRYAIARKSFLPPNAFEVDKTKYFFPLN